MEWTEEKLIKNGFKIKGAWIMDTERFFLDGFPCYQLMIQSDGGGWPYMINNLAIHRVMDVVGVDKIALFKGQMMRVALEPTTGALEIIGNETKDEWFDRKSFYGDTSWLKQMKK